MNAFCKKISLVALLVSISVGINARGERVEITKEVLEKDKPAITKYITEKIAKDIRKAKKYGKGLAHTFAGISHYAYDSIPYEYFEDQQLIINTIDRINNDAALAYIKEGKAAFEATMTGKKKRINRSTLAEFLYNREVDHMTLADNYRQILKQEPIKMEPALKNGIENGALVDANQPVVSKDEYMYYNTLNMAIQYYLEQEYGK